MKEEEKMKRTSINRISIGILVLAGLLLAACANPLNPPEQVRDDTAAGGLVRIYVGNAGGGEARTVQPAVDALAGYRLTFTPGEGGAIHDPVDITGGNNSTEVYLADGTYTITATAYKAGGELGNEGDAVALGSVAVTLSGGEVTSNGGVVPPIILEPLGTGSGDFQYTVNIDGGGTGVLKLWDIDGTNAVSGFDDDGVLNFTDSAYGSHPLAAGRYIAEVRLEKENGTVAFLREVIEIWPGVSTAFSFQPTPEGYIDPSLVPANSGADLAASSTIGGVEIGTGTGSGVDEANALSYSIAAPNTGNAEVKLALEKDSLFAAVSWTATAGTPPGGTGYGTTAITNFSTNNVLWVKVVSEDASTTRYYKFTLYPPPPSNGSFGDEDADAGQISGLIKWTKPSVQNDISGYRIFFGSDPVTRLAGYAIVPYANIPDFFTEQYTVPANFSLPAGAKYFLIYSYNGTLDHPVCLAVPIYDATSSVSYDGITVRGLEGASVDSWNVSYSAPTLTISGNGPYSISGSSTSVRIQVTAQETQITLRDLNIDVSGVSDAAAFELAGTNTTVNLTLAGTNTLKSGDNKAGIQVPSDRTLVITEASTGSLAVTGGSSGAGIGGGGYQGYSGTVIIAGGTVTATGGQNGAGIGGGYHASGGTVTITGGTVTATGGYDGAGIGGGTGYNSGSDGGAGGTVTISGGTVTATGGHYGAGIGGGVGGSGYSGSPGGDGGAGGTVTISGGTVTATNNYGGAGIGGGTGGHGIGSGNGGYGGAGGTITISGGTVTATSYWGAGIGGGEGGSGIGGPGTGAGGTGGAGGTVTINGGSVTATSNYGAGIGGGRGGTFGFPTGGAGATVTINGGTVTAISTYSGAGIGGGGPGSNGGSAGAAGTINRISGAVVVTSSIQPALPSVLNNAIVFNGSTGTQYGNVTLEKDLTIPADSGLTIRDGALTIPGNVQVVNNGNILITGNGIIYGKVTGNEPVKTLLTISGDTAYTRSSGLLTITGSGSYDIGMVSGFSVSPYERIVVASGVSADITLNEVNIDRSGEPDTCAFDMTGATVSLTLNGNNSFRSGANRAGMQVSGGSTAITATSGSGVLTVTGGSAGIGGAGGVISEISGGAGLFASSIEPALPGISNAIVINGTTGRVYGSVTPDYDITIPAGVTLAIPSAAGLTKASNRTITNNGVIYVNTGGTISGAVTGNQPVYQALTISGGSSFTYEPGLLTITGDGTYTIAMAGGVGVSNYDRIVVNPGVSADITLNGVNIDLSGIGSTCAFDMSGATVNLDLAGTNILKGSAATYYSGMPGLLVPEGATLVISSGSTGSLEAAGGYYSAGIGGNDNVNGGTITIAGGMVTATGDYYGAGIGGGRIGTGGTVTITGGTVTATGGYYGAGIGGGTGGTGGMVTITGGTVTATSGSYAAGIGGGYYSAGATVSITGGTVTATGFRGIGSGGDSNDSGTITALSGNAVVFASSIAPTLTEGDNATRAIVFDGDTGTQYGDVTLGFDVTIPATHTLDVPAAHTLTIPVGRTLTNDGTISNSGTITNQGTINGNGNVTGNPVQ
jgi:hypothetical protein